jgi:Saxitoxin biosynthesis operon protein SxtJ
MINPFKDTNWNPDLAERRKFARSLVVGFPILAAVMAIAGRLHSGVWKPGLFWLGAIGCAAGLVFWLIPQIAKPFYLVWYFVACCIGIVMSNALVAAFFALVITPTGLIMRALGRDPMTRHFDPSSKSYWRDVEKVVDPERYFRQY